ncbi:MAG: hypothetical protein GTO30_06320 [Acidobacteria bacterium]|nr:hypothetical protein [Acidobacteriota bacterium]NIM61271.1 hypothetical protein [Acidobacteriota bacterium]NIQ86674.1 hypothetical protein [Acidobacteriota bacterium]NIT12031.1 hypothetical protein [Acidobacteriota bacterium]
MGRMFVRSIGRVAAWLLVAVVLGGCTGKRSPVLEPLVRLEPKTPVVIVPGFTGSKLQRPDGKILWGSAAALFSPRDGGYNLALPLDPAARERQAYAAVDLVRSIRLGFIKVDIYGKLIGALEANGYRLGDLDAPTAADTLFLFPYDWRYNNVSAAADLTEKLQGLRRARGDPILRVHLICQSNAARIARYMMKYGAAPLADAEAGRAAPPDGIHVEKLILVGTANGGATNGFRNMLEGRSYAPLIGRKIRPEVTFTLEAAYETLPVYRDDLFFDERGATLDVDLFDATNWERYGWSVYAPQVERRMRKRDRPDLLGDSAARSAFLARSLDRARRLHRVLTTDVAGFPPARYYLVQNAYRHTPDRILLRRTEKGTWETRFWPQRPLRKAPLVPLATAPGDGHATVASQHWLSPQETASIVGDPLYVEAYHRTIVHHPTTHRAILDYLLE